LRGNASCRSCCEENVAVDTKHSGGHCCGLFICLLNGKVQWCELCVRFCSVMDY
jgi:hypothetical protein